MDGQLQTFVDFPPRFTDAVRDLAALDADLVIAFLRERSGDEGFPQVSLPAELLLRLAAILRCREWERCGVLRPDGSQPLNADELCTTVVTELDVGSLKPTAKVVLADLVRTLHHNVLWDTEDQQFQFRVGIDAQLSDDELDQLADLIIHQILEAE